MWRVKLIRNILTISERKNLALSGRSFHTSPKSARQAADSSANPYAASFANTCKERRLPGKDGAGRAYLRE